MTTNSLLGFACVTVLLGAAGCGRSGTGAPEAKGPVASVAATYMGQPVLAVWVDRQYMEFSEKLFKVDGKVVNIVETNALEDGRPLIDGEVKRPDGGWDPLGPVDIEKRIFRISACGLGMNVPNGHVVNFGCNVFILRCSDNALFDRKISGAQYYLADGQRRQPYYVYCVKGGWLIPHGTRMEDGEKRERPEMVLAEPLTRQEFVEFLNSGQALISGFRETTAEEAQRMKETDFRVFKKGAAIKREVPIVVEVPH